VVVAEHDGAAFTTSAGETLAASDVRYHLANTLSGLYSLEGLPDRAIVEQRIVRHEAFAAIAVGGTPDIRIILYRRVPAMAMVRLPTVASRGRANLHQGAVAAGVHLRTGETFGGVCHDRAVAAHPDTGAPVAGVRVPAWHALLTAAMTLADVLAMDYIGVDFVLDARSGPVVLEANARPGLAIQIANRRGLLPRLRAIEAAGAGPLSVDQRLAIVAALPGLDDEGV
jgi:alpha-L-glutamate ligase-like protein